MLKEEVHISKVAVDVTKDTNRTTKVEVQGFLGEDITGGGTDGQDEASELGEVLVAELGEVGVTRAAEGLDDTEGIGGTVGRRAHTIGLDVSEGDHGGITGDGFIEGTRLRGASVGARLKR